MQLGVLLLVILLSSLLGWFVGSGVNYVYKHKSSKYIDLIRFSFIVSVILMAIGLNYGLKLLEDMSGDLFRSIVALIVVLASFFARLIYLNKTGQARWK